MKLFKKFSILVACVTLLTGCNASNISSNTANSVSNNTDLVGEWEVSGIYYKNKLIDINDFDELKDLYDTSRLTINDDNTFVLMNGMYNHEGKYTQSTTNTSLYYLKGEKVFRYTFENGKMVEKEFENATSSTYSILLLGDDHNAVNLQEVDSTTLKAKTDSGQKIYVKSGTESEYLASNKLDTSSLSTSNSSSNKASSATKSAQQVTFTNKYGTATTICAHNGCTNYIASSGDTNCCTKHSNKCLNCGKYIDEDATYCMECLNTSIASNSSKSNSSALSSSSLEEKNALNKAYDYLDYTAFSYSGLIEQLEFEGYSSSVSKYAADNCGANWNEQAAKKAQQYLDYSSFSRQELIEQLEFEGFTSSQAKYGVTAVGY